MSVILASKSPRRAELLKLMGIDKFDIIPASGAEDSGGKTDPAEMTEALAENKALEAAAKCGADDIIIAADTLVFLDGRVLGKPSDEKDAFNMLRALSGRGHCVYTGMCVICGDRKIITHEKTEVFFRALDDEEIRRYIAGGEPMDKAGAYGAQGAGCVFVKRIDGDFFNVMGLPVCRLYTVLRDNTNLFR